jgi:hypothetical protein
VLKGDSSKTDVESGYNGYSITQELDNKWSYEALLERNRAITYPIDVNNETNPESHDLYLRVSMMNDQTYRLKANPVVVNSTKCDLLGMNECKPTLGTVDHHNVWEVPDTLLGNTNDDTGMRLKWGGFSYNDKKGGVKTDFFSTMDRNLVVSKYYIEMGFLVDSRRMFGFGERQKTFELTPGSYSSWTDGRKNHNEEGTKGGQSYGDHPFVLMHLNDGTFGGIFFKNSNAKVLQYKYVGRSKSVLNFIAVGGILDFFMFTGQTADEVIMAYHQVVGKAYLPPFWALGFHQSAQWYDNTTSLDEVLSGYSYSNMPLESIWLDTQTMKNQWTFELDDTRFKKFVSTAQSIHTKGQKIVAVIEAGIAANTSGYK